MKLVVVDFEQVFLNSEDSPSEFLSFLLRENSVAIISRCGVEKLRTHFDDFISLPLEMKQRLSLFPRRASIFYSHVYDKWNLIYSRNIEEKLFNEIDKTVIKNLKSCSLSLTKNNRAFIEGNEITYSIDADNKKSVVGLLELVESLSSELSNYEVRIKTSKLSISKRCKKNCACFLNIRKELNAFDNITFICTQNDHFLDRVDIFSKSIYLKKV
jgi:hypothetical protein